jgi:4-aminobutyrate aminotransferase-like enzyme
MNTRQTLALLRDYESRNVLFTEQDGSWPIVWERARGVHVWDAEGKKYLDLTAAFGVASAGHANPAVVRSGQKQMARLLHAMGDVHPHALKAQLARELSRITFERWAKQSKVQSPKSKVSTGKVIFNNSGFEAVEAALKTAILATGKRGLIAFQGAYHGLGYGALNATHRHHFRGPFQSQLREFGHFLKFPTQQTDLPLLEASARKLFRSQQIGAVLVEPIQARGGINVPPPHFLPLLRKLCDEQWFACEHGGVVPDLICLGKGLTGGFPLSACVGRADVMDAAWPASAGEAIHTSTFLGHPVGCAMALAQISEIKRLKLCEQSAKLGKKLIKMLSILHPPSSILIRARGVGLMVGLELLDADGSPATVESLRVIKTLLHHGFILLPEGEHGNIISFTPPLTITGEQLKTAVKQLAEVLR